jgi:hypothetical protein
VELPCTARISNGFSFAKCSCCLHNRFYSGRLNLMKNSIKLRLILLLFVPCLYLHGATPADEKAFTDKYKTAFEAKDTATLESFLYTTGSDPAILGFYKMMMSGEAGSKISKIELLALSPDDAKKAGEMQDSPTGGKVCLTLKPTKKLVITIEQKDANGSSSSSSQSFVAEKDGKLVIPVPGPCK